MPVTLGDGVPRKEGRTSALSLNLPVRGQVVGEQRVVGSSFSEVQGPLFRAEARA
jgi:hypothetical protein